MLWTASRNSNHADRGLPNDRTVLSLFTMMFIQ